MLTCASVFLLSASRSFVFCLWTFKDTKFQPIFPGDLCGRVRDGSDSPQRSEDYSVQPGAKRNALQKSREKNAQRDHGEFGQIEFVVFGGLENNGGRNVEQDADDDRGNFVVIIIDLRHELRNGRTQRRHERKGEHEDENRGFVEFGAHKENGQDDGDGEVVHRNGDGHVVMVAYRETFE